MNTIEDQRDKAWIALQIEIDRCEALVEEVKDLKTKLRGRDDEISELRVQAEQNLQDALKAESQLRDLSGRLQRQPF